MKTKEDTEDTAVIENIADAVRRYHASEKKEKDMIRLIVKITKTI